ncbi:MAG: 16S rRNA (cytosine(1402)-N(4))-methyltransferase RsmH [Chloroflexi bacterium]|nr:16S rRNA (cytosine(1402)-N(4))-methyltransferase RsmH [Chloroflexota bacterium]
MSSGYGHVPVLLEETVQALAVLPGGRYIDGTVDGGGHAEAILVHSSPGGQLLGLDADPQIIKTARERLKRFGGSVLLVNDNFANLQTVALRYEFLPVNGILFDLGLSSVQLEVAERGFSFQKEGPLDMRFGPEQKITAADIVNGTSENELAHLIRTYGEEGYSRQIAHQIVRSRPISTTLELAGVIEKAVSARRGRIHPATRTFQALRIAVNEELRNLDQALEQATWLLGYGGRLVVISYHSLEDRIVKQFMQRESRDCICPPDAPGCVCHHKASIRLVNRRVVTPSPEEIRRNARSRSARLRAAEKIILDGLSSTEPNSQFCIETRGWRRPSMLKKIRAVYSMA